MKRKIIIILIILGILLAAYSLIGQIIGAFKSSDRLSDAVDKVYNLEVKNKELKGKLAQIKSPEFIEQQARDKLGLSKQGETVIIIPEQKLKEILGASQSAQIRLANWLGWLKVFFH